MVLNRPVKVTVKLTFTKAPYKVLVVATTLPILLPTKLLTVPTITPRFPIIGPLTARML